MPFPGSSVERAIFSNALFKDKLCRIEFCARLALCDVGSIQGKTYLPASSGLMPVVRISCLNIVINAG